MPFNFLLCIWIFSENWRPYTNFERSEKMLFSYIYFMCECVFVHAYMQMYTFHADASCLQKTGSGYDAGEYNLLILKRKILQ